MASCCWSWERCPGALLALQLGKPWETACTRQLLPQPEEQLASTCLRPPPTMAPYHTPRATCLLSESNRIRMSWMELVEHCGRQMEDNRCTISTARAKQPSNGSQGRPRLTGKAPAPAERPKIPSLCIEEAQKPDWTEGATLVLGRPPLAKAMVEGSEHIHYVQELHLRL